jgi:hypothetical protein
MPPLLPFLPGLLWLIGPPPRISKATANQSVPRCPAFRYTAGSRIALFRRTRQKGANHILAEEGNHVIADVIIVVSALSSWRWGSFCGRSATQTITRAEGRFLFLAGPICPGQSIVTPLGRPRHD